MFFILPENSNNLLNLIIESEFLTKQHLNRLIKAVKVEERTYLKIRMKTEDKNCIPKVRVAILGKSNVGKSALTVRYLTRRYIGEYRRNTDLLYKQTLTVYNTTVDVEIVDVCSAEAAGGFPEEAVLWADACVVVYDITSMESLKHATELLSRVHQVRQPLTQCHLVLLGNKSDLEHLRQVDENEGRSLASRFGAQFAEVSVAENTPAMYTSFDGLLNECKTSIGVLDQQHKSRKFSVSKMIGTLIGSNNNGKQQQHTQQGGTVVVCNKSDLYKSRVLKRRQNFTATASL